MKTMVLHTARLRRAWIWALLCAFLGAVACDPGIEERDPPGPRTQPVFDPATATIPLPNDLALQEGRLPALPGAEEANAEGVFLTWLSGLHGWLAETPIVIPFSGPLDTSTISDDSVRMYRIDGDGLTQLASCQLLYEEDNETGMSRITILASERLEPGQRYGVVVTKDIRDAAGEPLLEPLAIYLAASRTPLVDEAGNPTVSVLADDPATAQTLEILRQLLAPLYAQAEAEGVPREDVAMGFTWQVIPDPVANFDPGFDPEAVEDGDTVSPLDECLGFRAPAVPVPNTAALDPDGTFPIAATCFADEQSARGDFDRYLAGLQGWPTTTPITLPLTGPIDPSTIEAGDVQLWAVGAEGATRIEDITVTYLTELVDRCTGQTFPGYALLITPGSELDLSSSYVAFATRDIQSEAGLDLVPAAALLMAIQPYDVIDGEGNSLVANLSDAQAQSIAGLRTFLRPVVEVIEASTELTYEDLASVWTWFTWTDTFAVFDPATGRIPIPNAALADDDGVNLPVSDQMSELQQALFNELNTRLGFSVSAPGWIPFDGDLDADSISHDTIVLASVVGTAPTLLTEDDYRLDYFEELAHVTFTPTQPLETRLRHVGIVTTGLLGANGRPVQPTPAFVFLRSQHSLIDGEGRSRIPDVLDDVSAQALEEARLAYRLLFIGASLIPGRNYRPEQIALAWAFTTGESTQPLQEYRAMTMHLLDAREMVGAAPACLRLGNCPEDPYFEFDPPADYPNPNVDGMTVDMSNVGAIQRAGEFMTTFFYDPTSGQLGTAEEAVDSPVGISVFLPRRVQAAGECEAPYDVALAVHGIRGERQGSGLELANELAAYPHCLATVTMDLLLHGGRVPGSTDLHPPTRSPESGTNFLSADIVRTKNHFMQSAIDLFVLTRIIRGEGGISGLEPLFALYGEEELAAPLFTTNVGLVAQSLGGIIGTLFLAVEPEVSTAVLNNTGGRMTSLLEESNVGEPILDTLIALGISPGTLEYLQTMAFVQWIADHADPFTFAPFVQRRPLAILAYEASDQSFVPVTDGECETVADCDAGFDCRQVTIAGETERLCTQIAPSAEVLMQMSTSDPTIPNSSTILLAETIGVSLENTTFDAPHGVLSIRDPDHDAYPQAMCVRRQAAQWVSSGLAGEVQLAASLYADACVDGFEN